MRAHHLPFNTAVPLSGNRATLLLLTVPTGAASGALVGIASDRIISVTIAGLIAGLVLGLLFSWIAKPEGGPT